MDWEREHGIRIGIVQDLRDPRRLGRVRVRFPTRDDQPSNWARLSSLMAGKNRGTFFRPEVGDEVLVAFEEGDPTRPYILGALWSTVDTPPPDDGADEQNNWRFIRSRCGHIIKLDDTPGAETIEILDKDGARKVIIDSPNRKIKVTCDSGDVEVSAGAGKVQIQATTVEIKATGSLSLEGATVAVKATGSLSLEGATAELKAAGTADVKATGVTSISGSVVKIN